MPSLKAFGRRWNLGSDDLVFPGIVEISVRGVWFLLLLVIYLLKHNELTCDNAYKIQMFYIGTLCLLAVQIILCLAKTILSSRGTMVDEAPRRHVATMLYLRLAIFLPEVAWAILGTIWTFEKGAGCQKLLVRSGKGIVLVEWLILATIIIFTFVMFDPLGQRHMRKRSMKDYNQVWHRRCRVLCCCIWGDENRKGAFEEIADMLTKFFKYKDIVLTDVLAGLVLLNVRTVSQTNQSTRRQHQEQTASGQPDGNHTELPEINIITETDGPAIDEGINITLGDKTSSDSSINSENSVKAVKSQGPESRKDWMTLENAEYYSRYAVGSYGQYNYVMCRNCDQRCGLCSKYRCLCEEPRYSTDRMMGDNSCECQIAAVLQYTSINPDDILFANFENQIYETPYFVALDESRKSVIIAIRGTKTFQDALTDLTALGEGFESEGVPPGNVHGGMLKVARHLHQQLEEVHIFDKIPEGYNVVLTGHSLGAGAAALLSMMLKHRFPDIKCFAFSPPGGLVSLGLQIFTEDFVCSVVLGNDIIPRLSLISMEKLKYSILEVIKHSKQPKYQILVSGVIAMCCGWEADVDHNEFLTSSPSTDKLFDIDENSIRGSHRNNDVTHDVNNTTGTREVINNGNDVHNLINVRDDVTVHVSAHDDVTNDEAVTDDVTPLSAAERADLDWGIEPPGSHTELRRKKEVSEPAIRPTTYQQFHTSKQKWKKNREDRRTGLMVTDPLYLPGHVMHVVEKPASSHLKHPEFYVRWAASQDFDEIIVSPNMLHHHHGYVMTAALQQIKTAKQYSPGSHETGVILQTQPTSPDSVV